MTRLKHLKYNITVTRKISAVEVESLEKDTKGCHNTVRNV